MEAAQQPKRGLSALLASTTRGAGAVPAQPSGASAVTNGEVPIAAIRANQAQPRTHFDAEALSELAASIKSQGLIQPLVVRKLKPEETTGGHQYELIAGERRWRASQVAGLTNVPVIIKSVFNDRDILLLSLVENLQREDLNPIEEALAYDRLGKAFGLKHEEIAASVGKARATVSNALRLLDLPETVKDALAKGQLSPGHAKVLLAIPDARIQAQLASKAQAEGLNVRDLERLVSFQAEAKPSFSERLRGAKKSRGARMAAPELQEAERRLREHFGTKVTVEEGIRKGRIVIEFYTVEDFQRITKLMNVD